jgi:hypothetical protein
MVGARTPVLISTSVLTGATAQQWRDARALYNAASEYDFRVNFDDVRFGYWGRAEDLGRVEANPLGFEDAKTSRFLALGEATWREVLTFSPAEPGLARAQEMTGDLVSAGGWSDLHPVLALENMGCEEVVYVTRTGDESKFARGVATLLGLTAQQHSDLYDLDNADSSFAISVERANGTWCTNWNDFSASQIEQIYDDGFNAPLETSDAFFTQAERPYDRTLEDIGKRGCTPGAAPAAP